MQCPKCESDLADVFECKCGWKPATPAAELQTPKVPVSLVGPGAPPVVSMSETESAPELEAQQPPQTLSANDDQPGEPRTADPELKGGPPGKHADNVQGAGVNKPVAPTLDPGANSPAQDRARRVEVKNSKAKRMPIFSGDNATYIGTVEINADGKFEEKGRKRPGPQQKDYRDAVSELPPRPFDLPRFLDGVEGRLQDAKTNPLILVSCADYDIELSAAYALVELLDIGREGQFWLNCEAKMPDNLELGVGLFLRTRNRAKRRSVIVVDATGDNGKIFLDPLIEAKGLEAQSVKHQLEANGLFIVCMVDSGYLANRLPDGLLSQHFSSWDIQFLHPLLKHHFPTQHSAFQATIEEQRSRGWWSGPDADFCREIKSLIRKGRLEDELKRKEALPNRTSGDAGTAPPIITADEAEQIIIQAAWFACAYFPNLFPRDFQRVVATLLDNQTVIVTVPSLKTNEQGEVLAIQTPVQKQLSEIWQQKADPILSLAGLELADYKESGRVIDFADPSMRSRLRRYFEAERRFYMEEQFRKIREHCLLFDRSRRIVESTIALAVDLTLASPDQHEMDWLIDVVCSISQSGSDEDETSASAPASGADDIVGRSYSSVSLLVRRMLEHPHLEPVVDSLFEQLMRSRSQEAVLQIVRRLRFSPQFDFYWVKQLVDRGSEEIRERASRLLSGRLKQQDLGIYETLRSLKSWLPDAERDEAEYSPSNECALLLLIEYCLSSTSEFDARYYGEWPCRYPLLAVLDARSPEADAEADDNLDLLAGWLFHPGLESVLNESGTSLVAALVAEWAVILLGTEVALKDADRSAATASTNGHSEGGFVLDLLIKRIARSTAPERQKELAQCWAAVTEYLLFLIANFEGYTSEQRRQLRARRAIILDVTKRFNTFRRQP